MSKPSVKAIETITVTCSCGETTDFIGIEPEEFNSHISQPCDDGCGLTVEIVVDIEVHAYDRGSARV